MSNFRLILVLLCIGLLGTMPFLISLPNPASADARQATLSQVRPEISATLHQAFLMGSNDKALKLIDGLSALPNKNNLETQEINQVRGVFVDGETRRTQEINQRRNP